MSSSILNHSTFLHRGSLQSLLHVAGSLWRHRGLVGLLTLRDLRLRYRGSFLGIAWALLTPLLLLGVYAFAFGVVFPARWPATEQAVPVALILFCGMTCFGLFAECLQRAPGLVVTQPQFVKKVVFPLEILPVTALTAGLFHWSMHGLLLLAGLLVCGVGWNVQLLWLPMVLLPLLFLCLGIGWLLAALGVFFRDLQNLVGPLSTILIFLSPVFYPLQQVPDGWQLLLRCNPLTTILENLRRVVLWQAPPQWGWQIVVTICCFLFMAASLLCFHRLKRAFADVV